MRRLYIVLLIGVVLGLLVVVARFTGEFTLFCPTIKNGGQLPLAQVFSGYGCEGGNTSPRLEWKDAPEGTQSFVLTVYDPDAPTGSGWWHWVVFNIPAKTTALEVNAGEPSAGLMPWDAIQSITDFGTPGFGGACPPLGDKEHRYVFTLYALNVEKLPLDATAMPAMVGYMMHDKIVGKASITATYQR